MKSKAKKASKDVNQYTHEGAKRPNNPPVGLVNPGTDPDKPSKKYQYDPRLDPQLEWSGKQENSEFEVDTVSLHVHERIDPLTILEKTMRTQKVTQETMFRYFETPENNPPLREAIDFYKHDQNWSNRLIAGDSLLVMNSLLEKEGMEGKIQMIYIDPPYGIKYGSNFQPFVNKKNVQDGKDDDLTQEPEMVKAFRDTWELKTHSYLSYLRNRLFLGRRLLTNTGSCFVQISDQNVHLVRILMDEVFGKINFVNEIIFTKTQPLGSKFLPITNDYIIWYAKNKKELKFHQLFKKKEIGRKTGYKFVEFENGIRRSINSKDDFKNLKNIDFFTLGNLVSTGYTKTCIYDFEFNNKIFKSLRSWKTTKKGMENLIKQNRIFLTGNTPMYVQKYSDFPVKTMSNIWEDTRGEMDMRYVVQTSTEVIKRCLLMTTDPSDLIFDPTCGSGTTAFIAEMWGRRWITCDSSRIAVTIAKQRLMTQIFNYYDLEQPSEGIKSGFKYKKIPHITLGTLANNEPTPQEILYDKPKINPNKTRISGPFTVEAIPSPTVKSLDGLSEPIESNKTSHQENISIQNQWRDELLKTGIRGKSRQKIEFSRVETHPATRWLHADAETKDSKRVMISFGPEHAPLEQRQVALAIEEAQTLVPKPKMIIFAAMQFDPEAAKDIDELNWPNVAILKVEMNKDLLTKDLKKKRISNESFWLMGQPDIELEKTKDKKFIIKVNGFDYYNTRTGEVESGGSTKISMWMLDEDYDGRSVYPQQVFFPMEGKTGGWNKLAKTLQAQIDEELIVKYQGIESIPFEIGLNKRAAVKIIDDRGIESLKIIELK